MDKKTKYIALFIILGLYVIWKIWRIFGVDYFFGKNIEKSNFVDWIILIVILIMLSLLWFYTLNKGKSVKKQIEFANKTEWHVVAVIIGLFALWYIWQFFGIEYFFGEANSKSNLISLLILVVVLLTSIALWFYTIKKYKLVKK